MRPGDDAHCPISMQVHVAITVWHEASVQHWVRACTAPAANTASAEDRPPMWNRGAQCRYTSRLL